MSSFAPFFACAGGAAGLLDGRTAGAAIPPGRVLAGGGMVGTFWVAVGPADAGGAASIGGLLFVAARFGSEPRPGGGGGGLLACEPGADEGPAARVDPETGEGVDAGAGAGAAAMPEVDGWVAGAGADDVGGSGGGWDGCDGGLDAGPGIPSSVFFASSDTGRAATFDDDPGGGGGAAGERSDDFFPRPSKISRSDPPPLLSFDIRVS